jgi:hypothetical protein
LKGFHGGPILTETVNSIADLGRTQLLLHLFGAPLVFRYIVN